jgi:2'-hydroxyisoflavone reductase
MRILVLGGTKFLGRAAVESALAGGHEVTLFNRGTTNPELFPEVEKLRGDRDGGLDALRGREWDAVVDPSGYVPRVVEQSVDLLRDTAGFYVFVSSISVYAGFSSGPTEEHSSIRGTRATSCCPTSRTTARSRPSARGSSSTASRDGPRRCAPA